MADGILSIPSGGDTTYEDAFITGDFPDGKYINERVTTIKTYAFASPTAYLKVSCPNVISITSPSAGWFVGTHNRLQRLYLPNVETVPPSWLRGQTALPSLYFPKLKKIGQEAFKGMTNVEKDVVLPALTQVTDVQQFQQLGQNKTEVNIYMPALTSFTSMRVSTTAQRHA